MPHAVRTYTRAHTDSDTSIAIARECPMEHVPCPEDHTKENEEMNSTHVRMSYAVARPRPLQVQLVRT